MWTFKQSTGQMFSPGGLSIGTGYSGAGADRDNPADQAIKNKGPIPEGFYEIGPPANTDHHGPFVLSLTPDAENQMYDRSGFLIHGDSLEHPGEASEGCIILARALREAVWNSGDTRLQVIP